jgi:prepilin-type processing-associated H-X9-DG protein
VIWTKPDDYVPNADDPLKGLLGLFPGGFNAGFCDGSVRFINESIDPIMLMRLFERNDGMVVDFR